MTVEYNNFNIYIPGTSLHDYNGRGFLDHRKCILGWVPHEFGENGIGHYFLARDVLAADTIYHGTAVHGDPIIIYKINATTGKCTVNLPVS
jgi:hypothetical protein